MKKTSTLLFTICLASCAAPKATIVQEETPVKAVEKTVAEVPKKPVPTDPTDGMRLPDMLALPDDDQLRSSPSNPSGDGAAPVIARPPKE